eukprot:symbB.v1.2.028699.t1/scaffold3068.1/size68108/5
MAAKPNKRRRIWGKRPPQEDDILPLLTLVINLQRRKDRWEGVCRRLDEFQAVSPSTSLLQVHRFQATDGRTDEVPLNAVGTCWNTSRNAQFDGRPGYRADVELQMTPGERGCAMSHVRAWRSAAERTRPVLVMEDDAVPTKSFAQRLRQKLPEAAALGADVLYLGHIPGAPWREKKKSGLYEAEYLWTTVAYVLWPKGAQKPRAKAVERWICGLWIDEFQAVGTSASGRASRQLHGMANCRKAVVCPCRCPGDCKAGAAMGPSIRRTPFR